MLARSLLRSQKFTLNAIRFNSRSILSNGFVRPSSLVTRSISSTPRRLGEGMSDKDLSLRLSEEIKYEQSESAASGTSPGSNKPSFVNEFLNAHEFKLEDQDGHDEVFLTKKFGNETIRVMFSVSAVDHSQQFDESEMDFEDEELENDEVVQSVQNAKKDSKKSNKKNQPPPVEEEVDEDEDEDDMNIDPNSSFPVHCSISISKPTGALSIDATAQDGVFLIEQISHYKDSIIATELSPTADWKRRGSYVGPQFSDLDENVQEAFEQFLEERGINTTLALFVVDYVDYKEQREYVSWLRNVKDFIDA